MSPLVQVVLVLLIEIFLMCYLVHRGREVHRWIPRWLALYTAWSYWTVLSFAGGMVLLVAGKHPFVVTASTLVVVGIGNVRWILDKAGSVRDREELAETLRTHEFIEPE